MEWVLVSVPVMLLHAEKDPSMGWLAYSSDPSAVKSTSPSAPRPGSASTTADWSSARRAP